MDRIRPKKYLGQNFLTDNRTAKKIVDILEIGIGDKVLEIGPGMGALTDKLTETDGDITCVEYDPEAAAWLNEKYPDNAPGIIIKDFLEFELNEFSSGKKIKVIGNIPYNISSPIIFKLLENSTIIDKFVLTVQKEVAERFAAGPGSKTYGIMSVAALLCGKPRKEFNISAGSFFPKPKVTSSVISFIPDPTKPYYDKPDKIMPFIRAAFSQRRKKISNSLKAFCPESGIERHDLLEKLGKFADKRAEELSAEDYIFIFEKISA